MSSIYSASSGAPPDGRAAAAAAPPRIRRAMALPSPDDSLGGLALTTSSGDGIAAVTVSAGATSVRPEHQSGQGDRGRTGGRLFPLAGRRPAERSDQAVAEEDTATGTSVAGVRAASLSAAQAGRTAGTTTAPGSRAGRPLFVAAAIAGAVLASVPFVHGKGGTVAYEGLGKSRPLAELSPDADDSDAILHPDGQAHSMPLLDPAEGVTTEPMVPQPETSPYLSGGPQGDLTLPAGTTAPEGPTAQAHVLDADHHGPGPVGPLALGTPGGPASSSNTNRLLLGSGVGAASGLTHSSELKGERKVAHSAASSGTSRVATKAPVTDSPKLGVVTVSDEQDPPDTTATARVATFSAATTQPHNLVTAVTQDDAPDATATARIATFSAATTQPHNLVSVVPQDDAPDDTTAAARVFTLAAATTAPATDGPKTDVAVVTATDATPPVTDAPTTDVAVVTTTTPPPPVTDAPTTDVTVVTTTDDTPPPTEVATTHVNTPDTTVDVPPVTDAPKTDVTLVTTTDDTPPPTTHVNTPVDLPPVTDATATDNATPAAGGAVVPAADTTTTP